MSRAQAQASPGLRVAGASHERTAGRNVGVRVVV